MSLIVDLKIVVPLLVALENFPTISMPDLILKAPNLSWPSFVKVKFEEKNLQGMTKLWSSLIRYFYYLLFNAFTTLFTHLIKAYINH
jgi:hypothetical protein